jgi:hypothetical protein
VSTAAERIKEARDRDEAAAFTAPEGSENAPESEPDETEEAEEAETTPTEPAPEPAPEQPPTGLNAEQTAELEKATTAYYRRVAKVFHGELPPECSTCNGLGFDLSGGEAPPDFPTHDHYIGCDDCDGLGKVRTGSQVPHFDLADCPKCQGRGYLEKLPTPQAVPDQPAEYGTPAWMGNVPPNTGQ